NEQAAQGGQVGEDGTQAEIGSAANPINSHRAERRQALADRAHDDIEAERLRARNEELERENRRLERENLALRSEVEELRAELAKRAPADDGLDISPSLRRAPR